jgi:hypothetical protein
MKPIDEYSIRPFLFVEGVNAEYSVKILFKPLVFLILSAFWRKILKLSFKKIGIVSVRLHLMV